MRLSPCMGLLNYTLRCKRACRHIDFDPLLRHMGHMGPFSDIPWVDLPMRPIVGALTKATSPAPTAEIGSDYALHMSRILAIQHTRYIHGYPDRARQLFQGKPRPEGAAGDELIYAPIKVDG